MKNLRCIQEAADELLSHMKGRDWSYRRRITEGGKRFSQEKLQSLVEELVSLWAETVRTSTDVDPDTGESVAEPYLRDRMELYGLYLYLVMRCSLENGAYSDARRGAELKERTDFAFLLEQAKRLSRDWCVMAGPDGTCRSELYLGYDAHFGFHLYYALHDPDVLRGYVSPGNDWSLTPDWRRACEREDQLTNGGNMKRLYLKHSPLRRRRAAPPEEEPGTEEEPLEEEPKTEEEPQAAEEPLEEAELPEEEPDASAGDDDLIWDPEEDDDWYYPFPDEESYREFQAAEWDRLAEEDERAAKLTILAGSFQCAKEYCSACERFAELFEAAKPEVLREFYEDLERIVDLYLAQRKIAPLSDTDKTLDVYDRVFDGPLRQARRYGRGIQWDNL